MKYAACQLGAQSACAAFGSRRADRIEDEGTCRPVRQAEGHAEELGSGSNYALDADTSQSAHLRHRSEPHLRIAVPAIIAHTLIAPALPRFLEQHRDMRVQLLIADGPLPPERWDAAICIRPLDLERQWSARRLAVMSKVLCASDEFLAVHGTPRDPHELDPAHCIGVLDEDSNPRAWSFRQGSEAITVLPEAPFVFSDMQCAVAAAVRGGGFILVPELAVESQIAAGLLRPLFLEWNAPRCAVWMKYAAPRTSEVQTFSDFVAGLLPSEPSERLA